MKDLPHRVAPRHVTKFSAGEIVEFSLHVVAGGKAIAVNPLPSLGLQSEETDPVVVGTYKGVMAGRKGGGVGVRVEGPAGLMFGVGDVVGVEG